MRTVKSYALLSFVLALSFSMVLVGCVPGEGGRMIGSSDLAYQDDGVNAAYQGNSQGTDIVIQAWHWNTVKNVGTNYYNRIYGQIDDMADNLKVTVLYLPPPWDDDKINGDGGKSAGYVSNGKEGYFWHDFNLNSNYGSEQNLKDVVTKAHGKSMKVITDMVPNHRDYQRMEADNQGDWNYSSGAAWTKNNPSQDSGIEKFISGDADIAIEQSTASSRILSAMNYQMDVVGIDGWRWDFVKGYNPAKAGWWMGQTTKTEYISIAEYWDTSWSAISNWCTQSNGGAFDFPLKSVFESNNAYNLRSNRGMSGNSSYDQYMVTFVDNHDTGYSHQYYNNYGQNRQPTPDAFREKAYAYIFSSPGIPCIYYPFVYKDDGTSHWMYSAVKALANARVNAGIYSESQITLQGSDGYAATVKNSTGTETLAVAIDSSWTPSGAEWGLAATGSGWKVWTKNVSGTTTTTAATEWANCYFRGTPNGWGTTAMTKIAPNTWETTQTFSGVSNPRFKVTRYTDWTEAYPTADYTVTDNKTYRIVFVDSTKTFTVTEVGGATTTTTSVGIVHNWTSAYLRGTPNSWGTTAMTATSDKNYEWKISNVAFNETNSRFKITRYNDWTVAYPKSDYLVTQGKTYDIYFYDNDMTIKVVEVASSTTTTTVAGTTTTTVAGTTTTTTSTTTTVAGNITLKMTKDVGSGYSIYFSGNCTALTNWGTGTRGTWTTGNVWQLTITNPGNFEWKVLKGPTSGAGTTWETGSNHNQSNLWPAFNGGF